MRIKRPLILLFAVLSLISTPSQAASIPDFINYQGQLTDAAGKALATANYTLMFSVYSAPSGGSRIWGPQMFDGLSGQGHGAQVPVVNGFFNVILGPVDTAGVPIGRALSTGPSPSDSRYIEITVGTGTAILPRQRFLSVPYALNGVPAGTVLSFLGLTAPDGYLLCDGSAVSRTTYAQLYSIVGVTFGAGDDPSTFNLPDFRGRAPVGAGTGPGLSPRSIGQQFGEETHTLSVSETPSHNHPARDGVGLVGWPNATNGGSNGDSLVSAFQYGGIAAPLFRTTDVAGGGQPHNVVQPSIALNFVVKY